MRRKTFVAERDAGARVVCLDTSLAASGGDSGRGRCVLLLALAADAVSRDYSKTSLPITLRHLEEDQRLTVETNNGVPPQISSVVAAALLLRSLAVFRADSGGREQCSSILGIFPEHDDGEGGRTACAETLHRSAHACCIAAASLQSLHHHPATVAPQ